MQEGFVFSQLIQTGNDINIRVLFDSSFNTHNF